MMRNLTLSRPTESSRVDDGTRDARVSNKPSYRGQELAASLLHRLFQRFPGVVNVRVWRGPAFTVGRADATGAPDSRFLLLFRNPEVICSMVLGGDSLRSVVADSLELGVAAQRGEIRSKSARSTKASLPLDAEKER